MTSFELFEKIKFNSYFNIKNIFFLLKMIQYDKIHFHA